jgi:hypothetical protein
MRTDEVRDLVRGSLVDLFGPRRRRALVLFTGGLLGFEDAIEELRGLHAAGVELDYVQTPSAVRVLDQNLIASVGMQEVQNKLVAEHNLLLAPTLTSNIAAKVAHGVADCLASNLFSEFLMSNRLVVASRTAICPDGAAKQSWFPNMPDGYATMLRGNLTAMSSFGVRLVESRVLCRASLAAWGRAERAERAPFVAAFRASPTELLARLGVPAASAADLLEEVSFFGPPGPAEPEPVAASAVVPCALTLISQSVISQIPDGVELRVSSTAKITAMARDMAARRSISITREV